MVRLLIGSADALKAMRSLLKKNFSGGGTDIQEALGTPLDSVNKHKSKGLIRPDVVLITDGEDSVSTRDLGETRLHSFFCEGGNSILQAMNKKSGGLVFSLR